MIHRSRSKAGMLLNELLIVLILLGVLSVILGELFLTTTTSLRDSTKRDNLLHGIDAIVNTLRRDTWAASSISTDGPGRLELAIPSGLLVTWRITPDGTLTRGARQNGQVEQTQSWTGLPPITFTASGPLLKFNIRSGPGRDESLTLVSQQLLAGGAK